MLEHRIDDQVGAGVRPSATADWLVGGGEMGALIRAFDWGQTALGPVECWPQSLRSAVSICLPSKAQIILCWGPELITLYNDGYRPVFGAKHPRVLGLPVRDAWQEVWSQLKPLFEGVMTSGEAFSANDLPFTVERHGYAEEAFFDVSYDPVRDESGRVGGIFCIVNETTGRVVGERRLGTLRDLGTRLGDAKSVGEVFQLASMVLAENRPDVPFAFFYRDDQGYPAGHPPAGAWPLARAAAARQPVTIDRLAGPLANLPSGPWPEQVQSAVVLPIVRAGTAAPHAFFVAGVSPRQRLDPDYLTFFSLVAGQVATALANVLAYEEERKRAEALAEIDKAKTAFFSNVSHEFRTPLTLMLGPIDELLRSQDTLTLRQVEQLTFVRRNSQRLLKLVNSLLDFSRIEAGRTQASYQPVDLATLTADLASNFRSACERAALALRVDIPPLQDCVYVDRDMYEKILLNLLSNAFKHTFDGEIGVTLRETHDRVQLTVHDTGTGIPARDLPHLFTRFYRVEGARGRSFEGTGIGLALVQELVHLHGGTIEASSVEREGSRFTVTLPKGTAHLPREQLRDATGAEASAVRADIYVEEALRWLPDVTATSEAADAGDAAGVRNAGRRVLVVDDNADLRDYLRHLLSSRFVVEVASNGEEALASARARAPDLVIADVMMPRLDGFGLIRALRGHTALSAVPVILVSARAGEEARIEGLQGGADDYLVKPFSARELIARVDALLEIARIRREADRRKDEFLAMLAHELRNPLAPIRTGLELIRLAGDTPAAVEQVRTVMQRQVAHMVRLIDDLLDVSRITAGKIQLQRQLTPLAVMINSAVEAHRTTITARRMELDVQLPDAPVWLDVDATRFVQVVSNVVHNAVKFTGSGGTLAIRGELEPRTRGAQELVLTITDSGVGIAPEMLPRVFDLFAQGPAGAERQAGLGIGLALARRLIEMHGGSIEAHSEGPGRGSAFRIRIPVSADSPAAATAHPGAPAPAITRRVLVIDDNDDALELMALHIAALGGESHTARDGQSGVEQAVKMRPHVVLIDIGMPGIDGYETCRRIREQLGGDAMLVAVSGWGQQQDKARAMGAGFDAHLTKPADPGVLASLLAHAEAKGRAVSCDGGALKST